MKNNRLEKDPEHIREMFDSIAHRYDCLNRWLSLRRDVAWRKALLAAMPFSNRMRILDLASGTGDVILALAADKEAENFIIGVDISTSMLKIAKKKILHAQCVRGTALTSATAENLCFPNNTFDLLTVAFGVRNFSDCEKGLREMCRVLRPGGRAYILEFSLPDNPIVRLPYLFYFRNILPRVAGWISKHPEAYHYLNDSVEIFPEREKFCATLKAAGFQRIALQRLTFGIATLYIAYKTH